MMHLVANVDRTKPPVAPGRVQREDAPPKICPRPSYMSQYDVYDGQRFRNLAQADDVIVLFLNSTTTTARCTVCGRPKPIPAFGRRSDGVLRLLDTAHAIEDGGHD